MYTFIPQSTFPSPTGLAREEEVGEKSLVVKRNLSQTLFRDNDFKNPTFLGTCYSCFKISADSIPTLWPVTRVDRSTFYPSILGYRVGYSNRETQNNNGLNKIFIYFSYI